MWSRRAGFTLIEILVVVVLISILVATVTAAFTGADQEQQLRGYAQRLVLRIEMARDRALQSNREWGIYIDEDGLRFAQYDEINGQWLEQSQRPFHSDAYTQTLEFELEVEAFDGVLVSDEEGGGDDENELPNIVLFSSGETTPFELVLFPRDWETRPWQLSSDGFIQTKLERVE